MTRYGMSESRTLHCVTKSNLHNKLCTALLLNSRFVHGPITISSSRLIPDYTCAADEGGANVPNRPGRRHARVVCCGVALAEPGPDSGPPPRAGDSAVHGAD